MNENTRVNGDLLYKGFIEVLSVSASSSDAEHPVKNLINGFGLSDETSRESTHDNHKLGESMWRTGKYQEGNIWLIFDFGSIYPIGEMNIWNYNQRYSSQPDVPYVNYGLKKIKVFYSDNNVTWTELKGNGYPYVLAAADGSSECRATNLISGDHSPIDFENTLARYVKITADPIPGNGNWGGIEGNETVFGLSAVRFYAGKGLYARKTDEWTDLFKRYSGWTGADASFSIPYSGYEAPGNAAQTYTLFTFGDTFISEVDPRTGKREGPWAFANNTVAVLKGGAPDPKAMNFIWGRNGCYDLKAVFIPNEDGKKYYYWLQDGIVINGVLSAFTLLVREEKNGREGFEFCVDGADIVTMPIGPDGPMFDKHVQLKTPLHYKPEEGPGETFLSSAILPNTAESGAPEPDGYIYVYGPKHGNNGANLAASRVKPENFHKFDYWEFWNGTSWSSRIKDCAIIAESISCEFSVTPMVTGMYKGKYLLVYQEDGAGRYVAYRVGESPVGPFGPPVRIYYTPEPDEGQCIYTYNAKAHPHLSKPGELLISYNTNSRNTKAHFDNGHIYRTRWICLKDTTISDEEIRNYYKSKGQVL